MIGKAIDWIGVNLGRIKTVGILALLVLFLISLGRHGCDRAELEDMVEKITGLNIQNDILNADIRARDTLLAQKQARITGLLDSIGQSEAKLSVLRASYTNLEAEYQNLSDSLLRVPADSSYEFLRTEAYPFPGEAKYPFNEPQVKGMHLTYLEKDKLGLMNTNLRDKLAEMTLISDFKDTMVSEYSLAVKLLEQDTTDLRQIIDNKDHVIDAQEKYIKKKTRRDTAWKIIAGAVVLVLAGIAAGGG